MLQCDGVREATVLRVCPTLSWNRINTAHCCTSFIAHLQNGLFYSIKLYRKMPMEDLVLIRNAHSARSNRHWRK